MTASTTASMPLSNQTEGTLARTLDASFDSLLSGLDSDTRALLSILAQTLFLLGLGTAGVVAITGQPPLFFIPLALFLLFGICLQWRQPSHTRVSIEGIRSTSLDASSARNQPFTGYDDKA